MANDNRNVPPMHFYGAKDPWGFGQIREIWRCRELLYSFFLRDLLIRYRQVFVGVLWVLLQPLIGMLIFMGLFFVLQTNAGADSGQVAYAPIVLIGMLCWQLVASSFRDATGSLVNYRHVVTKIYFPRMLLPLASLLCAAFDFLIGSLLVLPVCWLTSTAISWSTIGLVVPVFLMTLIFIAGCVAWLSSLNAHYRDVGYALPFVMQILMFVSPVVYDLDRVRKVLPHHLYWLFDSNPIACCIGLMRWAIIGSPMPSAVGILIAIAISIIVFLSGLSWFQHADQQLADRI